MCGVCGIARVSRDPVPIGTTGGHRGAIARMVDALAHRGPDEVGTEAAADAIFGATRLAIRGVSSGHQPIVDPDSGVIVVCNGEIDNAPELRAWLAGRGRTVAQTTDVAVIPGLYLELGESCVERLAGAFAVAVWDPRFARLLLARDRAGERPLFYTMEGGLVRFGTEIAALAAAGAGPLTPDRAALAGYLRFGSFTAPATPFTEIRKVPPAHVLTFDGSGVRARRYWRWGMGTAPKAAPAVGGFDTVFREAVRRQSEAEVPYGVFLSGGIDSSLVASVLRSIRPATPLTAYTLRFGEASYDEGSFAEQVASRLGCRSVAVWVHPEDIPPGVEELVRMVGEPLADPAWIPTALLARRAAQDVKLALVGEGADEIFGGYPTYIGARAAERFARWPGAARAAVRAVVDRWPVSDKKVTVSYLLKRFVAGAEVEGVARHLLWTSNIAPELLRRLGVEAEADGALIAGLGLETGDRAAGPGDRAAEPGDRAAGPGDLPGPAGTHSGAPHHAALLDLLQRCDLETSLAEGLLTKADRASMQSALELRAPFLDQIVLDWAAALPERERVRGFTTKVFLKRYALRYLPREIVNRRKRGLSVPLARWLRGPLREWARERLTDPLLAKAGVDPAAALAIFEEHEARRRDHARALWTLIVLDEWLRWAEGPKGR